MSRKVSVTRGGLREVGYARWVMRGGCHVRWVSYEVDVTRGGFHARYESPSEMFHSLIFSILLRNRYECSCSQVKTTR